MTNTLLHRSNAINELTLAANDANAENGAFARYIAVKEDLQMHIPDNVSFEAASTMGVAVVTVVSRFMSEFATRD